MYKKTVNQQILIADFNGPMGMPISSENRWVRKAATIPWDRIEDKYASLFSEERGRIAKPLRMALGSLLAQKMLKCSDRELMEHIKENPYVQYFIGLSEYSYEAPFVPSLLVEFRKRLSSETLRDINEMILEHNKPAPPAPPEDKKAASEAESKETRNEGTLILDATCAPQNIAPPRDINLLNTAREQAEKLIRALCGKSGDSLPRMYARNARRDFLRLVRSRRPGSVGVRKAVRKQLQYLRRDISYIDERISSGKAELTSRQEQAFEVMRRIYAQQKDMFDRHSHSAADRIVSFSQPYIRPIVRGKTKSPVEFGVKFDLSVSDGMGRVERMSFDAYNESTVLADAVSRYREREGHYPERVLADKIYRNRKNLSFCREHGIRLLGPALGRPRKDRTADRKLEYQDNADRIEVERRFGLCKQSFGLGLIRTKLAETTLGSVVLSVIAMNVDKIAKAILLSCDFSDTYVFHRNIFVSFSSFTDEFSSHAA